jgi:hypothetical protein
MPLVAEVASILIIVEMGHGPIDAIGAPESIISGRRRDLNYAGIDLECHEFPLSHRANDAPEMIEWEDEYTVE